MFKKEEVKKPASDLKGKEVDLKQPASKDGGKASRSSTDDIKAYFDEGIKLEGKLVFEGTARIDGQVAGEIISKDTVIIGEKAKIEAQIEVNTIIVSGEINGNITAKNLLHLKRTGRIYGDINTPSLIIEEGGTFEGGCSMSSSPPHSHSSSSASTTSGSDSNKSDS